MRDHWTQFLDEFGRHHLTDSIQAARSRADAARRQAEQYDREADKLEANLLPDIRQHWTDQEIAEAKKDAETYGTLREKTDYLRRRYATDC